MLFLDIDDVFDIINKADENDRIEIYVNSKPTIIHKTKDEFDVDRLSEILVVKSGDEKATTVIDVPYIRFIKILQPDQDDQ